MNRDKPVRIQGRSTIMKTTCLAHAILKFNFSVLLSYACNYLSAIIAIVDAKILAHPIITCDMELVNNAR